MMKRLHILAIPFLIALVGVQVLFAQQSTGLLTPEESLWLAKRNNTIVIYPEKNFPPYSYQSSSGTPQGLSIDYIELIAEKIGAKVVYLPARPLSQIFDDITTTEKGDVITSLTDTEEREKFLYFTDTYITAPAVIVVRKDLYKGKNLTLNDLTGKKVAIGNKYAVEDFVRTNNPRIVIESVVDDEFGLQQVVLGEVDAAIMDISSLSYYLSKQVLSSVAVAGNTGFEYKLAFAVPKDKEILQSILNKGLSQISTTDRKIFSDKWIVVPDEYKESPSFFASFLRDTKSIILYVLIGLSIVVVLLRTKQKRYFKFLKHRTNKLAVLKEEIDELEDVSKELTEELDVIRHKEEELKNEIEKIK